LIFFFPFAASFTFIAAVFTAIAIFQLRKVQGLHVHV
jgi:hypothetical protein